MEFTLQATAPRPTDNVGRRVEVEGGEAHVTLRVGREHLIWVVLNRSEALALAGSLEAIANSLEG